MFLQKSTMNRILAAILMTVVPCEARAQDTIVTVRGYVLDSACALVKNLEKPLSRDCALACAKAGSPLVILAEDGTIYWPISNAMPATGQNSRLVKFAGQKVIANGKVFERSGSRALVIEKVAAAPASK
jgi:hypothetical protein